MQNQVKKYLIIFQFTRYDTYVEYLMEIHGFLTYNKLKTIYSKDGNHGREFRNTSDWIVAVS